MTAPWGHASLGEFFYEIFRSPENASAAEILNPVKNSSLWWSYNFFYLYFPSLNEIPFKASQNHPKQTKKIISQFSRKYTKTITHAINRFVPDIVFSTHSYIFNPTLENLLDRGYKFRFFATISDPITLHPLLFSSKAINLCYDKTAVKFGKTHNIPEEKIIPIGWPVRKQFYEKHDPAKIRQSLGLDPKTLTFMLCGGSEGTNAILKILPFLFRVKNPLQIILVAGNNKLLYQIGKSLPRLTKEVFSDKKPNLTIKTMGFTNELASLVQTSDLVVGKAGPNLLFETIACERPFFAITHIHGQENGNLDVIRRKGLGWVEENGGKASKLLLQITENPEILKKFRINVLKEKAYNQGAEKKVLRLIR